MISLDSSFIENRFDCIELSNLTNNKLLSRFDRKYIIPTEKILELLTLASNNYLVLKIDNKVQHEYVSTYYDTKDYELYLKHHNGRKVRYKVRLREYIDSRLKFAEIKLKGKNKITNKFRKSIEFEKNGEEELYQLIHEHTNHNIEIQQSIGISYKRITLFHRTINQRVTIDTDICFYNSNEKIPLQNLAILEIKYSGIRHQSKTPFSHLIHKFEHNFSKYCIGIALLHPEIKHNNFLFTLKKIIHT